MPISCRLLSVASAWILPKLLPGISRVPDCQVMISWHACLTRGLWAGAKASRGNFCTWLADCLQFLVAKTSHVARLAIPVTAEPKYRCCYRGVAMLCCDHSSLVLQNAASRYRIWKLSATLELMSIYATHRSVVFVSERPAGHIRPQTTWNRDVICSCITSY
jgi:hypothetical protein